MLFGPAYKGIPLVTLTAAAPITSRVLIVDDVITAGTATREAVEIIRQAGGVPAGVLISLDRQEKGSGPLSAVQEAEQALGIRVVNIISLDDLLRHLETHPDLRPHVPALTEYRARYAVPS